MRSDGAGPTGWVVRLLLLLYPRPFRRRYGPEMVEHARWRVERGRRRGGRWGATTAALGVAADVAVGGFNERMGRESGVHGGRTGARGRAPGNTAKGGDMMGRTLHDLTDAARRLVRAPFFTLGAVAIVALGIGVNTAVFTLVDEMLFRPPPYEDPDRVVRIYQDSDDGEPSSSSFPAYRDMAGFTEIFQSVAAMSPATVTWEAEEGPRRMVGEYVTSGYLDVFGMEPSLGRWFDESHDEVGAGAFAVVSHHTWRTTFNADPGVVGRTIRLDGHPVTILGVGPRSLRGSSAPLVTDVWLSISSTVVGGAFRVQNLERRQDHWYDVRARLAPGVTVDQAQAAMDALAARLAEEFPELNRGRDITVFSHGEIRVHPDADGELYSAGFVLMGVVLMVLLLACSNLANLLLVRGVSRAPEVAVRRAMGASRRRVAGLFLTEAVLLAVTGGLVGLVVARG
ncbi:MAG TPA: ABC transporter permease, partial [Longimicrobiales bacterium]|nr:ABC transporter permease [Longimicrobiales bacterium]